MSINTLLRTLFLAICAVVALMPAPRGAMRESATMASLEGWPQQIIGAELRPVALNPANSRFESVFPGKIEEYTSEGKHYLFRGVSKPTRALHLSADCLRGAGYTLSPLLVVEDEKGVDWVAYDAARGAERLLVRERLVDRHGNGWTDVSAWYWNALLNRTKGPWLAVTVVSPAAGSGD